MKPNANSVAAGTIGFFLVLAVVVGLVFGRPSHHHSPATAASRESPVPSSSTYPSATQAASSPGVSPQATTAMAASLVARVSGFMQAYYSVAPTDTATTIQERLASFQEAGATPIDPALSSDTAADKARQAGVTLTSTALTDQLIAEPVNGDPHMLMAVVPVVIVSTPSSTGSASPSATQFEVFTTSRWQYRAGMWYILDFSEAGESG